MGDTENKDELTYILKRSTYGKTFLKFLIPVMLICVISIFVSGNYLNINFHTDKDSIITDSLIDLIIFCVSLIIPIVLSIPAYFYFLRKKRYIRIFCNDQWFQAADLANGHMVNIPLNELKAEPYIWVFAAGVLCPAIKMYIPDFGEITLGSMNPKLEWKIKKLKGNSLCEYIINEYYFIALMKKLLPANELSFRKERKI